MTSGVVHFVMSERGEVPCVIIGGGRGVHCVRGALKWCIM